MNCNLIDRLRLPFQQDKELRQSLRDIIGFYPHNIGHYKMALMHKSVMHRNEKGRPVNNERLEFLGDAVLDAIAGDIVYRHFPGKREGFLTNTRSKLVQREMLGKLAHEMQLDRLILSSGRTATHNSYMAGNAFEALVGAIYLDRGYAACMRFMNKRILAQMVNIDSIAKKEVNFKSRLLEWSQKNRINVDFELVSEKKDKSGSPTFVSQILIEGLPIAKGQGFSKKESQQNASKQALELLKKDKALMDKVFGLKSKRTQQEEQPVTLLPDTGTQNEEPKMTQNRQKKPISSENSADDEFNFDDIKTAEPSREDIIAAAEQAAYGAND